MTFVPRLCRALRTTVRAGAASVALLVPGLSMTGCEVDSWMDPSRTGYFEHTPTSIPILRKLDVIEVEQDAFYTEIGPPTPEDLLAASSEYQFASGDAVEIQINDLFQTDKAEQFRRVVDQSGKVTIPIVGAVQLSGMTETQAIDAITEKLRPIIRDPRVSITILEGRAFTFVVDGQCRNTGVYSLSRPDFNVIQAVALAGGAIDGVRRIRIVRVEEEAAPTEPSTSDSAAPAGAAAPAPSAQPAAPTAPAAPAAPSVDDLLKQIAPAEPATTPAPASPGALRTAEPAVAVDVDELEAPKVAEPGSVPPGEAVKVPAATRPSQAARYVFDTEKQEWVFVEPGAAEPAPMDGSVDLTAPNSPEGAVTGPAAAEGGRALMQPKDYRLPDGRKTRIIVVDWVKLQQGDLTQLVIVRPGDLIHVESDLGVVYIDGEISRPGVYNLPPIGELTLSRLVAAAGGFGQIAIPERVDLIRKVAPDREAVVRVNLKAIRNKAEPDIVMRGDDHIIIGTNFFATPLAVIRNGFRMTYGFGFLLDRNWGNDVFGAPPQDFFIN
jgi:protein involved in polysaccharide export with SLBB domain